MPPRRKASRKNSPSAYPFNAVNRGVYIADNLDFLRSLNDECIDLVCIDPPFDKNETFTADTLKPPLSEAERLNELRLLSQWGINTPEQAGDAGLEWPADHKIRGGYKDIWRWDADIHEDWVKTLENQYPAIHSLIETTRVVHSDGRAAYLCFMAIRLIEIRRALKSAGNLYLHCDHAANGYLRQLLDAVFGVDKFRNEISWQRTSAHSDADYYGNVKDTIFFYGDTPINGDNVRIPLSQSYVSSHYRYSDERGIYRDGDLTAPGVTGGESGQSWQNYNPTDIGRHWAIPVKGPYALWIESNLIPGFTKIDTPIKRLQALADADLIIHSRNGKVPSLKRYLDANPGQIPGNIWADIPPVNPQAKERTGYPTQKPVALAERIINASTNPGDVVLDCFAGCAYAATAAERLGRRWVACDMNIRAWTVFKRQFNKSQLVLLKCNDETVGQQVMTGEYAQVFGPGDLPERESPELQAGLTPLPVAERKYRQPKRKPVMTEEEMLRELLEFSGYTAWCCGFANRKPNGEVIRQTWNFHLDHIDPVSAGGIDEIFNRAPMCPHHNIRKSNKLVALREYRNQIAAAGELQADNIVQLADLGEAQRYANGTYSRYERERRPQQEMVV